MPALEGFSTYGLGAPCPLIATCSPILKDRRKPWGNKRELFDSSIKSDVDLPQKTGEARLTLPQ